MSVRVTAVDLETGADAEQTIEPGNYALIVVPPCELVGEEHHANGTTILTLKGRDRSLLGTVRVEPSDGHVYKCCGKVGRISRHEPWCADGAS